MESIGFDLNLHDLNGIKFFFMESTKFQWNPLDFNVIYIVFTESIWFKINRNDCYEFHKILKEHYIFI